MKLIHYQTLEAVTPEELKVLRAIKERFNAEKGFDERIKLWRKDDILACLEPREARWGFTAVADSERERVVRAIERMSVATPHLTWVLYEEGNGGEIVLRGGKPVARVS